MLEQHDGGRVEVERIPELPHEQSQTVEIANVQVKIYIKVYINKYIEIYINKYINIYIKIYKKYT